MPLQGSGHYAMSGNRYLLDTNAIVALLAGNANLTQRLRDATWIGISIISQVEFLAFSDLQPADRTLFQQFLQRVEVVGLGSQDVELIERIIQIRQQWRLKLPDAIIAAMALQNSATLVTADQAFEKITDLMILTWSDRPLINET